MSPRSGQSLLIVEDDGVIRKTLAEVLQDDGYSVVAVSELRAAMMIVQRHALVAAIVDWRLEHATAEPLLELLSREKLPVAVVLVSAAPEGSDIAKRYSIPFVKKPLDLNDLASAVSMAIRDQRTPRSTSS